jgi:hypothetical protein
MQRLKQETLMMRLPERGLKERAPAAQLAAVRHTRGQINHYLLRQQPEEEAFDTNTSM